MVGVSASPGPCRGGCDVADAATASFSLRLRMRRRAAQERLHRFLDLLRGGGVECGQQVGLEGNLTHRLALRLHEQREQVEHLVGAVQVGFHRPCRGSARTFRGVRTSVAPYCALTSSRKRWSRASRDQRGVFVAVGDEFERFLAAHPLVAGLEVDFEVLFAARFVDVVVAPVHRHVDAAHFVHRALELGEGHDEDVVDRDAEHPLDRFGHQLDPAERVGEVDPVDHRRAPGGSIVTCSSRGIESIEIVGLLGIDPHEQHLVGVRHARSRRGCSSAAAGGHRRPAAASPALPLLRGREHLRGDLDGLGLAERFDDLADLVERHHRGRPAREQHDAERCQQDALGHPPARVAAARRGGSTGGGGGAPRRRQRRRGRYDAHTPRLSTALAPTS